MPSSSTGWAADRSGELGYPSKPAWAGLSKLAIAKDHHNSTPRFSYDACSPETKAIIDGLYSKIESMDKIDLSLGGILKLKPLDRNKFAAVRPAAFEETLPAVRLSDGDKPPYIFGLIFDDSFIPTIIDPKGEFESESLQ